MKHFIIVLLTGLLMITVAQAASNSRRAARTSNVSYVEEEKANTSSKTEKENFSLCGAGFHPVRVAGFVNYPPFGWVETQKNRLGAVVSIKNEGLAYALFEKIAQERGLEVKNNGYMTYTEGQKAVRRGQSDVLLATYYDNDPYATLDIVFPAYLSNPFVIVSLKGTLPEVKDFAELAGKKGVVRKEEMIWPLLQPTFPKTVKITEVSGARNAFKKLITKEADFMITSLYAAEAEMRRFKIVDAMDVSRTVFRNPNIFMAFSQVGPCAGMHKDFFEKRMKELVADKDFMRGLITQYIIAWEKKFKDEPSLLTEEGLKLDDETEVEETEEDSAQEERVKSLEELDPEILIQQEMEKMHVSVADPIAY